MGQPPLPSAPSLRPRRPPEMLGRLQELSLGASLLLDLRRSYLKRGWASADPARSRLGPPRGGPLARPRARLSREGRGLRATDLSGLAGRYVYAGYVVVTAAVLRLVAALARRAIDEAGPGISAPEEKRQRAAL